MWSLKKCGTLKSAKSKLGRRRRRLRTSFIEVAWVEELARRLGLGGLTSTWWSGKEPRTKSEKQQVFHDRRSLRTGRSGQMLRLIAA
jgi:hypothetical protein